MRRGAALCAFAALGQTSPSRAAHSSTNPPQPDERAAIRRAFEDYLRRHRAPGLVCAIARYGQAVYADAFGVGANASPASRAVIALSDLVMQRGLRVDWVGVVHTLRSLDVAGNKGRP